MLGNSLFPLLLAVNGQLIQSNKDMASISPLVGFMAQESSLYEDLTVKQNIDFAVSVLLPLV